MTERFAINAAKIPIVGVNGLPTPEMYRWMVRVQGVTGNGTVGDIIAAPILTFDDSPVFTSSLKVAAGTGISVTAGTGTFDIAVSADVVTLDDTQTLTNKTLTSPVIATPEIDGGTADNLIIGATTPADAKFTTITATELVTLPSYTVATLPALLVPDGSMAYVSDEVGGAVPAFFDGADWRRVTDRAVVS